MQIKSVLFSKANGSIGGLTGGQDQGGQYLRKKIQPRKKQTAMQKKHTDYFKEGNALFKTIRPYWYRQWAEYALTLTKTNALGIEITYSPAQAFMRSYVVYRQIKRDTNLLLRRFSTRSGFYPVPDLTVSLTNNNTTIKITNNIRKRVDLLFLISDNATETTRKYRGGYKVLGKYRLGTYETVVIDYPPTTGKRWLKAIRYENAQEISKPVIYPLFKTTQG